jgi:transposase-like protein
MATKVYEKGEPKIVRQMTLGQFEQMFPDEDACRDYLFSRRWPNGVRCPRCGNDHVYASKARPSHWQCKKCGKNNRAPYRFSLKTGTIFEETKYPLLVWFKVLHLMMTSKKGISALQTHRMIGSGSYRTAWYMCHRLRAGLKDPDFRQLMGIVEVDETYIGGKAKNRHGGRTNHHGGKNPPGVGGPGTAGKIAVIGAISRKGNVVCKMIENTDTATLDSFVRQAVSRRVDLIATDEHAGYRLLGLGGKQFGLPHGVIRHSSGEYVRGLVHTNSIEGFWSLLKRGIIGTYHNVSKKYLPLYLNEFQFRFNNRKEADIFGKAIAGC